MEAALRVLKVYKELMESIRKGPSSNKKCYAVNIDWMRKFQAFGRALLKSESTLKSVNVSPIIPRKIYFSFCSTKVKRMLQ